MDIGTSLYAHSTLQYFSKSTSTPASAGVCEQEAGEEEGGGGGRKYSSKGNDEATTIFIHPAPLQIDYRLITRHGSDDETF